MNKPKILFILGNGFDLHCGLKTSYKDFIRYYNYSHSNDNKYNIKLNDIFKLIDIIPEFFKKMKYIDSHKNLYDQNNFISKSNKNYVNYTSMLFRASIGLKNKSSYNFWLMYFQILHRLQDYSNNDDNLDYIKIYRKLSLVDWCDIEGQIGIFFNKYSKLLSIYSNNLREFDRLHNSEFIYNKLKKENNVLFNLHKLLYDEYLNGQYLNAFMPEVIMNILRDCGYNPLKDSLYGFLFNQIKELEKIFKKFLNNVNRNKWGDYKKVKNNTIKDMLNGNPVPYNLITFNYTDNMTKDCIVNDNVHSTIIGNNKPIFGIDSTNNFDKPYYRFTKTYRIMKLAEANESNNKVLDLAKGNKKIIFYGQSLAPADYSYFVAIFNHYKIYENQNISLIFCYTPFNNEEEQHQFSRIYKLMNKYGEQFDHSDILHKMLLEKRIMIKAI